MEPLETDKLKDQKTYPNGDRNGKLHFPMVRTRYALTLAMFGFLVFLIGLNPGIFGLDRGVSIGFVQILTLLIGLGLLTWGATIALLNFWDKQQKPLLADFGLRIIATGYVICVFAALADAFGLGTNPLPDVFMGVLQTRALAGGMLVIAVGLVMLIRFKRVHPD
ncbi:MAG: hypothetical protein ACOYKD_00995 [Anaerolineaceae bacterium]|jgi:hypothetical protein